MWNLANPSPYRADARIMWDRDGAETLVVLTKATWSVHPDGRCIPAENQRPILEQPRHAGAPGKSSLLGETDWLPSKPMTDVILLAHAYAPPGRRVDRTEIGLRVGPIQKRLKIVGDRRWTGGPPGFDHAEPQPFERIPLLWERAEGGTRESDATRTVCDQRNPIGRGYYLAVGDMLANVLSTGLSGGPAGLLPIERHWLPRRSFGGTYDDDWRKHRHPLLPADFDEQFYQCAPADQQTSADLSDAPVELENLTPTGRLRFRMPRMDLQINVEIGGGVEGVRPRLHTVCIEPDVPRVILTWHAAMRCQGRSKKITRIHVRDRALASVS
jgi:hypothetical protein